jgi:predicted O-linked N-acetylglucosamine transferase (SPINDLY family)
MFSGTVVEVQPGRQYNDYMALMEEADIGIDCYHFGGSNTVSDNLHLRKPVVAWASDKWYGRIGSQLLRTAGLGELAATNEEEYLNIALRLIHDDDYRAAVTERVQKADLESTIYNPDDARYFRKAVDYLIENHTRLKQDPDPGPVRIERD